MKAKRRRTGGTVPGGRWVYVVMEPALWRLFEKLQVVVNERLKEAGRHGLTVSGVATLVLKLGLLDNAEDIRSEDAEVGLNRLALQLAPLFGDAGLAAANLPAVAHVPRGRARRARASTH